MYVTITLHADDGKLITKQLIPQVEIGINWRYDFGQLLVAPNGWAIYGLQFISLTARMPLEQNLL